MPRWQNCIFYSIKSEIRAVSGISEYRLYSDTPGLLNLTDDLYFPGAHICIKQTSFSGFLFFLPQTLKHS